MHLSPFPIVIEIITACIALTFGQMDLNEFCGARPTLVPVDDPYYRYFPHMVTLYRCGGTIGNDPPNRSHCVSDPAKEVTVKIMARSLTTNEFVTYNMKNHTSCKLGCALKETDCDSSTQTWNPSVCRCDCKRKLENCENNMVWNADKCGCVCPKTPPTSCPENKVWDPVNCQCTCKASCVECANSGKILDTETCLCTDPPVVDRYVQEKTQGGIRIEIFIGVIAAQFVFSLYAIFEVMMYPKQAGFMYKLKQKCSKRQRSRPADDKQEQV